jgi:polyhydroxyalkanoate synthesis regulator phasin
VATKAKEAAKTPEEAAKEPNPLLDAVRKVLLASIGAVALAQDEMEDFVDKLVERGELAEKEGKDLLRDVMQRRKKDAKKAEEEVDKRMSELVDRLKIPSKADIDSLSTQIDGLSKKVDELSKKS